MVRYVWIKFHHCFVSIVPFWRSSLEIPSFLSNSDYVVHGFLFMNCALHLMDNFLLRAHFMCSLALWGPIGPTLDECSSFLTSSRPMIWYHAQLDPPWIELAPWAPMIGKHPNWPHDPACVVYICSLLVCENLHLLGPILWRLWFSNC